MSEVTAFSARRSNADLVIDLMRLHYIREDDLVLDPTFGLGRWWTKAKPLHLVGTDLNPELSLAGDSVDFRNLPFDDNTFDAVVFDPPYKLNGVSHGFGNDASYGVSGAYVSIADRHRLIMDGIGECARVTKRTLIVKCQDQVSSGKVQWQTRIFADYTEQLGFRLIDMLHVAGMRRQPAGRNQLHARRNYSTALIFTKTE